MVDWFNPSFWEAWSTLAEHWQKIAIALGTIGGLLIAAVKWGWRPISWTISKLTRAQKPAALHFTLIENKHFGVRALVRKGGWALQFNDHIDEPGDIVFRHACKLGFEGMVSKRLGSPYVSGRSQHWKNPPRRRSSAKPKRTGEISARSEGGRHHETSKAFRLPRHQYLDCLLCRGRPVGSDSTPSARGPYGWHVCA
jgi:hypothetical protein